MVQRCRSCRDAVAQSVPAAGEPQRVVTVQLLVRAGLQVAGWLLVPVRPWAGAVVAADRHRVVDVDGDPAERVDDLLEALEVDLHVVVDVQTHRRTHRHLEHVGALVVGRAENAGVLLGDVLVHRVQVILGLLGRTVRVVVPVGVDLVQRGVLGERHPHPVAAERHQRGVAGPGVDARDDDGVGPGVPAAGAVVSAEQEQVQPGGLRPRVLLVDVGPGGALGVLLGLEDAADQVALGHHGLRGERGRHGDTEAEQPDEGRTGEPADRGQADRAEEFVRGDDDADPEETDHQDGTGRQQQPARVDGEAEDRITLGESDEGGEQQQAGVQGDHERAELLPAAQHEAETRDERAEQRQAHRLGDGLGPVRTVQGSVGARRGPASSCASTPRHGSVP